MESDMKENVSCMFEHAILYICLSTCSGVNEDTLVGPQVAEVKEHHVGSDVVDRESGRLLEAHALWDEEGVARRHHRHLLPEPEAVQRHHLITDLEQNRKARAVRNVKRTALTF